jgi:hypothetical protein
MPGATGPTGAVGSVLPSGKTETGVYFAEGTATTVADLASSAISFPVPLASAPTPSIVTSGSTTDCPGSADLDGPLPASAARWLELLHRRLEVISSPRWSGASAPTRSDSTQAREGDRDPYDLSEDQELAAVIMLLCEAALDAEEQREDNRARRAAVAHGSRSAQSPGRGGSRSADDPAARQQRLARAPFVTARWSSRTSLCTCWRRVTAGSCSRDRARRQGCATARSPTRSATTASTARSELSTC